MDAYDSDDSGFDDGLSTDEVLLGRIARMRDMMNLAGEAPPPAKPAAPVPSVPPPPPPPPTKDDASPSANEAPASESPTTAAAPETEEAPEPRLSTREDKPDREEDEFLLVEGVQDLSLSQQTDAQQQAERTEQGENAPESRGEGEEEEEEEEEDGYDVTWARGQLGLLFKAGARGETLIRRINKKTSSAEGLHLARAGDVLVAINGENVQGRPFQAIVEQLRLPDFPVKLSFQPLKILDDDDEGDGDKGEHFGRPSDSREMHRKESSLSALSTTSSANDAPPYPGQGQSFNGPPPTYRLNDTGVPPPPPYNSSSLSRLPSYEDPLDEYEVVWRHGTLGCGLKQRNGLPTIKSVTPGAAADPSVQQISPGDVMVMINGKDTSIIGFRAVVETMQRAPKPVHMRFRRSRLSAQSVFSVPRSTTRYESSDFENLRESRADDIKDMLAGTLGPRQYTVLWKDGPLGVQIKPRSQDRAVIVSKFTGTGDPELLSNIHIGDLFVRIAGVEVADIGITGTYDMLKNVQKPVVLVFERASPPTVDPPIRQGFSVEEPRDSTVPSFRELRERQAAAQQEHRTRDSFAGFTPEQRGDTVFGAAERRAALTKQRPASYDAFLHPEDHDIDFSGPLGRYSFPEHQDGDVRYDRTSDPSYTSGKNGRFSEEDDPTLPRFSDIELGRIQTATVTTLPPPPAYHDTFTQSGRFLDPSQLNVQMGPTSPQSDGRPGSSTSSGPTPPPGPGYGQALPYTRDPPPPPAPGRATPSFGLPPPPSYDQHIGNARGSQRIDRLRQQYIESERMRNQGPYPREGSLSEISSYSELDDSGVIAAMRRQGPPPPSYPGAPSRQSGGSNSVSLPTPELWIQWSEGPLGITFRRTNGQIVVSRLTGAGYSRGLDQLRAGDWLVSFGNPSVGTYSTAELRLAETMDLIKKLPKPVDMRFVVR